MNSDLFDHLKKFKTNPYLFIGSGLSRRYLGLPTWEALLNNFFTNSGITGDFEYYQSKSNGDLPLIATELAKEFFEIWWKDAKYKSVRDLQKGLAKEGSSIPIKIEIANLITKTQKLSKTFENEINLLKTSVIDGVITTNWDSFIESTFNDFNVYIGQQELLFSESISIGEIYKIHGCVTRPQSLVLTKEDYLDFNNRNAYLAAKLLTIFVEHPIIFIGYSLSDTNILQIIDSIVQCVEPKNLDKLKDRLIFVEWQRGKTFEIKDSNLMLPENKVLPIKLIQTASFEPIFETLSTLTRQIPVKILRKLKNAVVEFVKSNNPSSKIYVKDIDAITDDTDVEYAIGVGIATSLLSSQGYKGIDTIDIIEDILNDNKNFNAGQLIEHTLSRLTKGNGYVPVYKYLKSDGHLNKNGTLNQISLAQLKNKLLLKSNPPICFLPPKAFAKKQVEIRRNHKDINSVINAFDKEHSLNFIPLLDIKQIDQSQLLKFLRVCFKDEKLKKSSAFRKLVCLYDYLNNGNNDASLK